LFKLLRYFSIASLAACGTATLFLWQFSKETTTAQLISASEQKNIEMAQLIANSIGDDNQHFLSSTAALKTEDLKKHPQLTTISEHIREHMKETGIVKVKLFDLRGRVIFSTDQRQIGKQSTHSQGFISARSGKVITKFASGNQYRKLGQNLSRRSLLSSYIPIRQNGSNSPIEGVFELYSDVTPLVLQVEAAQRQGIIVVFVILSGLYGVLFVIVCRADRILVRQEQARQLAEAQLAEKIEALARSNTELEQFAYVASHDLQEPLRKIEAFGDRLKTKCGDELSERGHEYIDRMQSAASRMRLLIQNLLAFSRVTTKAQPFTAVNLQEMMANILDDLDARIQEKGAQVDIAPLPVIDAEPMQMYQLFQNLISNALKFCQPDQPLSIKVASQSLTIAENNGQVDAAEMCQISVADNGIGFEQKYTDRIFKLFQRLHSRSDYEGTGIGLAVCAKIAEYHGGFITANSTPGEGATFIVTLPIHQMAMETQPS
jgi:signal transduction histidine kinase